MNSEQKPRTITEPEQANNCQPVGHTQREHVSDATASLDDVEHLVACSLIGTSTHVIGIKRLMQLHQIEAAAKELLAASNAE